MQEVPAFVALREHRGGVPEEQFRKGLTEYFTLSGDVIEAYLAVGYARGAEHKSIGLLLRLSDHAQEGAVVQNVSRVFSQMFAKSQTLDIVPIDNVQAAALRKVIPAFYVS